MGYNRPYDYMLHLHQRRQDSTLDEVLQDFGDDGWELAGILNETHDHHPMLIFKKLRVTTDET
jgi:hypothetical protein